MASMTGAVSSSLLFSALAHTWPAAAIIDTPPFTLRDGAGGGKRVSAATAQGVVSPAQIRQVASQMPLPLFMVQGADDPNDSVLNALGYRVVDPTVLRVAPIAPLAAETLPPISVFTLWEPLHIMRAIWAEGGIGPDRVAVMERAACPKTALLARSAGKPAGAGFVALHGDIAMVHALEILPRSRRQGAARNMMISAAKWAQGEGARYIAVAVTAANVGGNALYASLNMPICAKYHYRLKD